jgi:glycosyltransferase involved in cell wall biosynthesis
MPVYDPGGDLLTQAIESVRNQLYTNWELCIADDASTSEEVREVLTRYASEDERISVTYRDSTGHISAASNTALEMARGEFVALLDHDDELSELALYLVAETLNEFPDTDIVFSDEDKIDLEGRRSRPYFKPDFSPDLLLSHNCISHLGVYRTELLREIGGFRLGFEGSQDWDLALRAIERSGTGRIRHIPFVLYHWRVTPNSASSGGEVKPYARESAQRAISEHLERNGFEASVEPAPVINHHRVRYSVGKESPRVTIIVPLAARTGDLERCLESVLNETEYGNFEIVVACRQNEGVEESGVLERLERSEKIDILWFAEGTLVPGLINRAAEQVAGDVAVVLDSTLTVASRGWLREVVSLAIREGTGMVGGKCLSADGLLENTGVLLDGSAGGRPLLAGFPRAVEGYFGKAHLIQNFSCVAADCIGFRREVFLAEGGFDEKLAMSAAGVDLCARLARRGLRIVWSPHIVTRRISPIEPEETPPSSASGFEDPLYNPNLSLEPGREFQLAFPPRTHKPWL